MSARAGDEEIRAQVHDAISAASPTDGVRHYALVCSYCGRRQNDDGLVLDCPDGHPPALLQTEYVNTGFNPCPGREGLSRYQEWLPVTRLPEDAGRTVVYNSKRLAGSLGLRNLWIAFNGYWPERGAALKTATFKELEAHTVLGRMTGRRDILTVASSGNTGAAFAWACSRARTRCLLIVPGRGMRRLRFAEPLDPCVSIVVIDDGDYPDAIELASAVSREPSFRAEGGVRNVGRRDGLGTVLLSAFEEMNGMPSHYFQAVGSGAGAIAVLEAAKRLRRATGEARLPRLMLCQNRPFTPIYDAWRLRLRSLKPEPTGHFRDAARRVYADELTNRAPPYGAAGGVYDALVESRGDVLVADNAAVRAAMDMFSEIEGIDIEPAAGVALACLREAAAQGRVGHESMVLLNITGGGRERLGQESPLIRAAPRMRLTLGSLAGRGAALKVAEFCASAASAR
jgi:cysteate synthase